MWCAHRDTYIVQLARVVRPLLRLPHKQADALERLCQQPTLQVEARRTNALAQRYSAGITVRAASPELEQHGFEGFTLADVLVVISQPLHGTPNIQGIVPAAPCSQHTGKGGKAAPLPSEHNESRAAHKQAAARAYRSEPRAVCIMWPRGTCQSDTDVHNDALGQGLCQRRGCEQCQVRYTRARTLHTL